MLLPALVVASPLIVAVLTYAAISLYYKIRGTPLDRYLADEELNKGN